ncbi:protein PAM68, chloroplastic [Abrus precatorius]|uniref:Protein PAM68, chloroplastic n=1 Tax=Abrus precatorius TaxID=3816 RepID=A0A8B8LZE2_ABRPR|nr:protein PAM68, chloroplastic [Abrus precatorius]
MATTTATLFNPQFLHMHGRNSIWVLTKMSFFNANVKFECSIHRSKYHHDLAPICATLRDPKGFGPSPKKRKKSKNMKKDYEEEDDDEEEEEEEEPDRGVIPEVVTNRMMSRMAVSVGIPLGIGLLFFPLFYYLKVGLKIDVPTWMPFIVSFFFFGSALLGVSYGIVSSSWDPLREGSFWGWNEAQKNWPVFWQSLRGDGSRKN